MYGTYSCISIALFNNKALHVYLDRFLQQRQQHSAANTIVLRVLLFVLLTSACAANDDGRPCSDLHSLDKIIKEQRRSVEFKQRRCNLKSN